jgi:hypothetical protein
MADLLTLAESRHPAIQVSGATPEERMLQTFEIARGYMLRTIPAGTQLDVAGADAASEGLKARIMQQEASIAAALAAGADLSEELALRLGAEEARQWYVNQYSLGCSGLGAYASGYAQDGVNQGVLSKADYDDGIVMRTRIFANIAYAGMAGKLPGLIDNERTQQRVVSAAVQAKLGPDATIPFVTDGELIISSQGMAVRTMPKLSGPMGLGLAIPAWAVVVTVIAVVAALTYGTLRYYEIKRNAALLEKRCMEADAQGYKAVSDACNKYFNDSGLQGLIPKLLGEEATQSLVKILAVGGMLALALYFAPAIIAKLTEAQHTRKRMTAAEERRLLTA